MTNYFVLYVFIYFLCCDQQAFTKAWDVACSTPKSVFLVPEGRRYLVNATRFKGPCADTLIIQVTN